MIKGQLRYRADIQGLRAIAVLAVMIFHLNSTWLPAGFIGVDIFFVISGYLISSIILKKRDGFSFVDFYLKRVNRIFPAYYFMLIVIGIISVILFIPQDVGFFLKSLKIATLFYSNTYFSKFGDYFAPDSHELPLLHTWSLAIEMQFYLLLPFVIIFIKKKYLLPLLFLLIILIEVYSCYLIYFKNITLYYSLMARIPEFLIGTVVAIKPLTSKNNKNIYGIVGVLLILLSLIFIPQQSFPGLLSLIPCVGTALIISNYGVVNSILSSKVLEWIGNMSYSLYLWHWPILSFLRYYYQETILGLVSIISYFILSFLMALISYKFMEIPLRKIVLKKSILLSVFTLLFFIMILSCGKKINTFLSPTLPIEYTRYAGSSEICHGQKLQSCQKGDLNSVQKPILVIGDSQAAQLNLFFDNIGKKTNRSFNVLTASSCVPIHGFDYDSLPEWGREPCKNQTKIIDKELLNSDIIIITGLWKNHLKNAKFYQALSLFLKKQSSNNKKIIVLAQVPIFEKNISRLYRFNNLHLPSADIVQDSDWRIANKKILALTKQFTNVTFVDFSNSSIFQNAPYYDGKIIYFDKYHLNEYGALIYSNEVITKLDNILNLINEDNKQ